MVTKSDDLDNSMKTKPEVSVIIIGAGAAGIAAASKLFQNGITNVTILEAENRIGGRVHSVPFGGTVVELGAQWCHGEKGNLIYELVRHLNLLEYDPYENVEFYHSSHKPLNHSFIRDTFSLLNDSYMEEKDGIETSLGDYILQRFNTTLVKEFENDTETITLLQSLLEDFKNQVLSEEGAFSWFDVAAQTDYEEAEVQINLAWKGRGFKRLLDVLVNKYPNATAELPVYQSAVLQKDVVKIISSDETPKVQCSDNTTYSADHVIWTPSLGVLKHRYESVFEPQLGQEKVTAIKTIGFDAVGKILYYFPFRWWPSHVDAFSFIWDEKDGRSVLKEFPHGYELQGRSWLTSIKVIVVDKYNPNVLTTWITGEDVPLVEKLDDDVIINGTTFVLQKFLGHKFSNLTVPEKIIREKWFSNDHFRGTYTYDTLESRAQNFSQRDVLATPLNSLSGKPVVLFAGEATNPVHFGTVHGAIETGFREAERILNYYK